MADDFASTETASGLLKNDYVDSPIAAALKKKRKKLAETRLGDSSDNEENEGD